MFSLTDAVLCGDLVYHLFVHNKLSLNPPVNIFIATLFLFLS